MDDALFVGLLRQKCGGEVINRFGQELELQAINYGTNQFRVEEVVHY